MLTVVVVYSVSKHRDMGAYRQKVIMQGTTWSRYRTAIGPRNPPKSFLPHVPSRKQALSRRLFVQAHNLRSINGSQSAAVGCHIMNPPPSSASRSPSIHTVNQSTPTDALSNLKLSNNGIAAGIGEALEVLAQAGTTPPMKTQPIFVEWEGRVMALGRRRMTGLGSGKVGRDLISRKSWVLILAEKNAFLYVKSKLGLLASPRPLYLQASFFGCGTDGEFVEVDLDAWEELAPFIDRLRVFTS